MTPTGSLRELLDARGVEHEDFMDVTFWKGTDGTGYTAAKVYTPDSTKPSTKLAIRHMATPEQAIATTLGAETCHLVPYNENYATCSECGISLPRFHGGWWFYCPGCGRHLMGEKVVDE